MGVAPQLRWRLIIKANSGLSISWPYWDQDSLASQTRPRLVGLLNTMGKGAVVGMKVSIRMQKQHLGFQEVYQDMAMAHYTASEPPNITLLLVGFFCLTSRCGDFDI